ncbi:threonine aldolase family protein [Ideonella sp.]|uniref:threonine aldolase family protein n=1 Tax=Ideonella sp. TaxID=1929293 RepID=UPI002E361B19|nr:beta-eliminating lyase-related protein [Ideonella sp.]
MPPPSPSNPLADPALRNSCTAWLSGRRPRSSMKETLLHLADAAEAEGPLDVYGEGELVQRLEQDVAQRLGKVAALFLHKGVAAQLAAMRVWTGGRANAQVALHRKSHIELDEAQAHEHLLGLRGVRLGHGDQPFKVDELEALVEKPALVIVELPLRRAGFRLTDWSELEAISAWCRQQQVPLHFDGARLWEASAGYRRAPSTVAALADSVYVSFYKGLGGLAGCALAGPADFIKQVRLWQTRLAGNLYTVFPYVLSATIGLKTQWPRMAEYHQRALQLATALAEVEGLRVAPEPPHTNSFQVHLPGEPALVRQAMLTIAQEHRFWLSGACVDSVWPDHSMIEVAIGDTSQGWTDAEVVSHFRQLLALVQRAR